MARRTAPPFRADHVGSLLRPQRLLKAREDFANGRIQADELRAAEDEAIREVVKLQEDVGLQSVTDGEFRRASWHMDFIYELGGVNKAQSEMKVEFRNAEGTIEFTPAAIHVDERISLDHPIFGDAFGFLKSVAGEGSTPKLTIPSPSMVHFRGGRAAIDESVYPDLDSFWADLSRAYADEVRELAELGCTYLQFDDTSLAYLNDPAQRERVAREGADGEHLHETYIRNINRALEDRPEGMTITTHMCRGNFRSSWVAEGELRLRGGGPLRAARRGRLLPGVRRRPLGRLRAAPLRAEGQAGGAGPSDHQARGARVQGRAQAAGGGGLPLRGRSSRSASRRSAASRPRWRATP